jgi:LPXTG-site transpeptidase (sortase) family protein
MLRRAIAVLIVLGVVLVLTGIVTAVCLRLPDIRWESGLIEPRYPYPSRLAPASVQPETDQMPAAAELVIPRIGVVTPVRGGDAMRALASGAYHHAETADPGQGRNVTIASHRETGTFSLLPRLVSGDQVILYWFGTEHDYRVVRVFEVGSDNTSILDQGAEEMLTLYTCAPGQLGDRRTVVVAEAIP